MPMKPLAFAVIVCEEMGRRKTGLNPDFIHTPSITAGGQQDKGSPCSIFQVIVLYLFL
jgi:hypothetical protein